METISAPNGTTKFIKPDFGCVLYEEVDKLIYGRIDCEPAVWNLKGTAFQDDKELHKYALTLAPIPWYENLGDGILCKVWDYDEKISYITLVTAYYEKASYPYETVGFSYINAQPLTQDEVMKYIAK